MSTENALSPPAVSKAVLRVFAWIENELPQLSRQERGQLCVMIRCISDGDLQAIMEKSAKYSAPEATFHPFKKLPREVRDRIWEFSGPGPRFIIQRSVMKQEGFELVKCLAYGQETPAILHVCRESRAAFLSEIIDYSGTKSQTLKYSPFILSPLDHRGRRFMFSPKMDMLYIELDGKYFSTQFYEE